MVDIAVHRTSEENRVGCPNLPIINFSMAGSMMVIIHKKRHVASGHSISCSLPG